MKKAEITSRIMLSDKDMTTRELQHVIETVFPPMRESLIIKSQNQELDAERIILLERVDGVTQQAMAHLNRSDVSSHLISFMARRLFSDYADYLARKFSSV